MSKIVLPPLPGYGDLANALGASLAMQMCVTKWKDGIDIEVLQRDVAAMLRARDLEVARVVRDRIADIMDAGGYRSQITAISIRKLEFTHE